MRIHLDVLGWLYVLVGLCGGLAGLSLAVLAFGSVAALATLGAAPPPTPPAVWLMIIGAVFFGVGGGLMIVVGRALARRGPAGRRTALVLALPNLLVVPFGTALGIYTFWALLNDEARREFGQPLRSGR
ncbi:MAG: hypothetical protein IT184_07390 [Acidobacteria bacterium]|nr:hypothetical protein [Acidobacteriota bacterium]